MTDIEEISQLILHERQGRDRGWWEQMRQAFLPGSTVNISWFSGTGPAFVDRSQEMSGRGDRAVHRNGPPVVHVNGPRAFAEVATAIEFTITFDDVPAHLVSYARLVYRLEKHDGRWQVLSLDAVYERDALTPAVPGQSITVDPGELDGTRPSYALLAVHLRRRGYPVNPGLLGDDRPEQVSHFYAQVLNWLNGKPSA